MCVCIRPELFFWVEIVFHLPKEKYIKEYLSRMMKMGPVFFFFFSEEILLLIFLRDVEARKIASHETGE